jgi:hypothetical protein
MFRSNLWSESDLGILKTVSGASLWIVLAFLLLAAPARATDTTTAGGNSNDVESFTRGCDVGKLLIGLKVQRHATGGFIERIQGICSAYDASGARIGAKQYTAVAGGSGTTSQTSLCPDNTAIKAIRGRYGSYVDRIQPVCANVAHGGDGGSEVNADALGNSATSGSGSFNLSCPNAELGRALIGKHNWYVDRIGLRCATIEVAATAADVTLPLEATAGQQSTGFVALNGYARDDTVVVLEPDWETGSWQPGLELPSHVVIHAGDDHAAFTFRPTSQSAGCLVIKANAPTLQYSRGSEYLFVSSPASGSANLVVPVFAVMQSSLTATYQGSAGTAATLSTNTPTKVTPPARTPVIPKGASAVSFQIPTRNQGCAVVTGQVGVATLRRALLVYSIGG